MDVIVVGYGKIGRIKAFIWKALGRKVTVYDVTDDKKQQALDDGFTLYDSSQTYGDLVVDISTPASFHLQSLEWVLENINPLPRGVLIEKPLASDLTEIKAVEALLAKPENSTFAQSIAVNESYYLSSALQYVANDIFQNNLEVLSVSSELSKNRLDDVANGRFIDKQLGSLGIELPHMIAMVQWLGYNLDDLSIQDVTIYQRGDNPDNEGFSITLQSSSVPIKLESYLGDFRFQDNQLSPNKMTRTLQVKTNKKDYLVMFDPVEGLDRYKSKIIATLHESNRSETLVLDDNHLSRHLEKIHNNSRDTKIDGLASPANSLRVSELMFELKNAANYQKLKARSE